MKRFLALAGSSVGGTVGWLVGARFGLMSGYILSVVGSGLGLYYTARFVREYLP